MINNPELKEIVIPYRPRYPQTLIHPELESHRFNMLVTHRQLGKTVLAVNHMIKMAMTNPRPYARYFYIAPFLKQAKLIAWEYFKRFTAAIPGRKVNESGVIELPNSATVYIYGADNEDAIRGTYADGVVLDEYAQIKRHIYHEIVRAMLTSRNGWVLFSGTPKGQNQFYEEFQNFQRRIAAGHPDYWLGVYRADETGVISEKELAEIKAATPVNIFRQEYLCDFTASADNVLIPIDLVTQAQGRNYSELDLRGAPKIIGIDPARFGDDSSVICRRQGLQAYAPIILEKADNVTLAGRAAQAIKEFKPDAVFIDAGHGAGVIDILRRNQFDVTEIPFGGTPLNPGRYVNRRAEMWGEMCQWIRSGGALPANNQLANDLTIVNYDFDVANRIRLEPKDRIKARLGRSPDLADALALTFALPVQPQRLISGGRYPHKARTDYNVLDMNF